MLHIEQPLSGARQIYVPYSFSLTLKFSPFHRYLLFARYIMMQFSVIKHGILLTFFLIKMLTP